VAPGSPLRSSNGDRLRGSVDSCGRLPSAATPARVGEPRSLAQIIDEVSKVVTRLGPFEAFHAAEATGLIVDIRAQDARDSRGVIPGSLHIPRTVLEWRVAPDSAWRSPFVGDVDQHLILICDHGYSSVLAAGNLVELGFRRASDVVGGFEAWESVDLPVVPCRRPSLSGELPGMAPPEPNGFR
jgi:rhodanese-related sulfurtransferase